MHFVKTGGFNGYIEYFDRMVARILPFRKRIIPNKVNFDSFDFKMLEEFNTPEFLDNVKSICLDKSNSHDSRSTNIINEIYQLDLLLMLPGKRIYVIFIRSISFGIFIFKAKNYLCILMYRILLEQIVTQYHSGY
jgi:hypothetical protein